MSIRNKLFKLTRAVLIYLSFAFLIHLFLCITYKYKQHMVKIASNMESTITKAIMAYSASLVDDGPGTQNSTVLTVT